MRHWKMEELSFEIYIKENPPGINKTYKISNSRMYKDDVAVKWQYDTALQIGAKAGTDNWTDKYKHYAIYIQFGNCKQDVDAPIKLVIDTLTQKLGFDDSRIIKQCSHKILGGKNGVIISLYGIISN